MRLFSRVFYTFLSTTLVLLNLGSFGCGAGSADEPQGDGDANLGNGDGDLGDGDGVLGDGDGDTPQGTGGMFDFEVGETDEGTPVVLNEFMPSNATIATDMAGGAGDWIELYNLSSEAVDLGGYFISDKLDEPQRYQLPAGLIVQPLSALLLWADNDVEEGADHLPFKLAKDGEAIVLTDPSGLVVDSIDYLDATTDSSFARVPDGTGAWAFCTSPTPAAPNDASCGP